MVICFFLSNIGCCFLGTKLNGERNEWIPLYPLELSGSRPKRLKKDCGKFL